MKKLICLVLSAVFLMSICGCSDNASDKVLTLDIENASIADIALGIGFEDFKASDVVREGSYSVEGVEEQWEFYRVDSDETCGIDICGYPAWIESYYKDGVLYYISLNSQLEVDSEDVSYEDRSEIFSEATEVIEAEILRIAGTPNHESRAAVKGALYPAEDDESAVTSFTYFVKDGKVLEGEIPLTGTMEDVFSVYDETDYDYLIVYSAAKEVIMSESQAKTDPFAGGFGIGIFTKEAMTDRTERTEFFQRMFEERVENTDGKDPGLDIIE